MQQINLYRYLPHPIKSLLDARALLVLCGVFCLALLFSSGIELVIEHHDRVKLNNATAKYQAAQHQLVTLAAKYPSSIVQMKAPDEKKLAYCQFKFSNYLQALANGIVAGVWLTDISISERGKILSVKGHALVESQAQLYVDQLNEEPFFKETPFILQDVERAASTDKKPASDMLNFRISTKAAQDHG
jgi:hypothetical protein